MASDAVARAVEGMVNERANRAPAFAVVACAYHPGRAAIARCVACQRRICAECSTPVDGIHRCAACVAELAPTPAVRAELEPTSSRGGGWASLVMLLGLLVALVWGTLELALP